MRLLETDATQFDTELLDIYLTEADEVLDAVAESARNFRRIRQSRSTDRRHGVDSTRSRAAAAWSG